MFRRLTVMSFFLLLVFFISVESRSQDTATSEVKHVLDKAMEIQTRPDLTGESNRTERARLIRQLISENFLSGEMARETIKETWDKVPPKQRSQFQNLFIELFQDSYTRMVLNFLQKENVEYKGEFPEDKGKIVKTVIMRANEHIPVDYHLVQKGGRWSIMDVDIDEVSIVNNYRHSFRKVIQTASFDALLEKMRLQSLALKE